MRKAYAPHAGHAEAGDGSTPPNGTAAAPSHVLLGTNLEFASVHNQRVTLQAIRIHGPISTAELARVTGLTPPAVANIVRRRLADGLIRKVGRSQGARGQPSTQLAINPEGAYSIGVNIDRDHVTLVALDFEGRACGRATRDIGFGSPEIVAEFVRTEFERFTAEGVVRPTRLAGVGVAIPDDLGTVALPERPADYGRWNDVDLHDLLGFIRPIPLHVANDAAAAAVGELHFGLGLQNPNFFYLLISAGLGGGLVMDGHLISGASGRSGEIGALPIRSAAGNLGDVVSLAGLYTELRRAGYDVQAVGDLDRLPPDAGEVVDRWVKAAAAHLVQPFMAINAALNPGAIYLGGRLPPHLFQALAEHSTARLQRAARGLPAVAPVTMAALAADAAAFGAAILPFYDRFLPLRGALLKREPATRA